MWSNIQHGDLPFSGLLFLSLSLSLTQTHPPPAHTHLEENRTTVQFSQTTYSVSESDDVISLQVEAVATGSPPATVQVTVSEFPGTMTSMNYDIPSDGSSVLNYTGIDDSVFSGNRTLTLTLNRTDTFVVVGAQSTATVMISEDDSKS